MSQKKVLAEIQIGKNGVTENFLKTLKTYFKQHKNVKISVLKSVRPEGKKGKEIVKKFAQEIHKELGKSYAIRLIGFKIAIKKLRR